MSPKDKQHTLGMTVEKVSLAVLGVLGIVGLAYFTATGRLFQLENSVRRYCEHLRRQMGGSS
jgi:hypothetical protein